MFLDNKTRIYSCGWSYLNINGLNMTSDVLLPTYLMDGVQSASCGWTHCLIITNTSRLYGVGSNGYGQLGLGNTILQFQAPILNPYLLVKSCVGSAFSSLCILLNGSLVHFGNDLQGESCTGVTTTQNILSPVIIPNIIAKQVSRLAYHTAILNESGIVFMCGLGLNGNLGLGDQSKRTTPTQLIYSIQNPISMVGTNYQASIFISNGEVLTTGFYLGELINVPKPVFEYNGDVLNITSGYAHTFTITSTKIGGFGYNAYGNLAQGDNIDRFAPDLRIDPVFNYQNISKVVSGYFHTIFQLKNSSTYYGVGFNAFGSFGSNPLTTTTPVPIFQNYSISKIFAKGHNVGFLIDQDFYVCGYNVYSQLGTGDTVDRSTPVLYMRNVTEAWLGEYQVFVKTKSNEFYGSGYFPNGNLCQAAGIVSTPTRANALSSLNVTNLFVGIYHTFFVLNNGSFYGCGYNSHGQLGIGTSGNSYNYPVLLPFPGIKDIKLGFFHTLILTNNNTVYSMGQNLYGQLGVGDSLNRVIPTKINITNVLQIDVNPYASIFLAQCPSGRSGPNCQETTCFGISSLNTEFVCSGSGNCTSLDVCQCFPPSFGNQCEFAEYHWRGGTGLASVLGNWYIANGNIQTNPIVLPNQKSIVYLDQAGTSTVIFDIPLTFTSLFIGNAGSKVSLNINSDLTILNTLSVDNSSSISSNGAKLTFQNGKIFGNVQFSYGDVIGNILFYSSVVMNFMKLNIPNLQIYSSANVQNSQIKSDNLFIKDTLDLKNVTLISPTFQVLGSSSITDSTLTNTNQAIFNNSAIFNSVIMSTPLLIIQGATTFTTVSITGNIIFYSTVSLNLIKFKTLSYLQIYSKAQIQNSDVISDTILIKDTIDFNNVTLNASIIQVLGLDNTVRMSKIFGKTISFGSSSGILNGNDLSPTAVLDGVKMNAPNIQIYSSADLLNSEVISDSFFVKDSLDLNNVILNSSNVQVLGLSSFTRSVVNGRTISIGNSVNFISFTCNTQTLTISGTSNSFISSFLFGNILISGTTSFINGIISGNMILNGYTVLNNIQLSGNLNINGISSLDSLNARNSNITLNSESTLTSSTTLINSNVTFLSNAKFLSGSLLMDSSLITSNTIFENEHEISCINSTIINRGKLLIWKNGIIKSSPSSLLLNYGELNGYSQSNNISLLISVHNYNMINMSGGNTTFGKTLITYSDSSIILNSYSIFTDILNITNGDMFLGGYLSVPFFIFNSVGTLRIYESVKIDGNLDLLDTSTLIIKLRGSKRNQVDFLDISGNITIKSLIIAEASFSPQVGDLIPILSFKNVVSLQKNIFITGTPFKGASFSSKDNIVYLNIEFSFGSASNPGYQCSYIGYQKILEVNQLYLQNKMIISMTVPIRGDKIGFGFDLNGDISQSILLLTNGSTTRQYHHDPFSMNPLYLIGSSSISQTIFNIGPNYQTLTLIVPFNYLSNQRYIYYSEINSINSTHYFEKFDFPILRNGSLNKNTLNCTNFLQPTRGEIYNIPATVIMLVFYIFIFILCLIFSRFQPLKTRGLSPYLTLIFLFIQLLLEIRNYFEIPSYQGSLCVYYAYGIYPFQQLCFILILLYFIRYFSIINLNENKKSIYDSLKLNTKIPWIQKFKSFILKFIASIWFIFLIIISYMIALLAIFTIILGSYSFKCQYDTLITLKSIHSSFLLIIYLCIILTLLIDIISNYNLIIKLHWIQYAVYSDPYYFRMQILLFFPFIIFSAISDIYFLATSTNYTSVITHFTSSIVLNTVIYSIVLIIEVLLPLIITIYELIKMIIKKNQRRRDSFEEVIQDKEVEAMFIEFCQSEFSIENILCYKDIQEYKKLKTNPVELYLKYLNGNNSVMELNTSLTMKKAIFNKIKNNEIDETLFDPVLKDLHTNLSDTYSRFIFYPKYMKYLENKTKEKELIEGKK